MKPDFNRVLEYIQTALELSRELYDLKEQSYNLMNLASIQRRMGNVDESLESLFKAKEIMEQLQVKKKYVRR